MYWPSAQFQLWSNLSMLLSCWLYLPLLNHLELNVPLGTRSPFYLRSHTLFIWLHWIRSWFPQEYRSWACFRRFTARNRVKQIADYRRCLQVYSLDVHLSPHQASQHTQYWHVWSLYRAYTGWDQQLCVWLFLLIPLCSDLMRLQQITLYRWDQHRLGRLG